MPVHSVPVKASSVKAFGVETEIERSTRESFIRQSLESGFDSFGEADRRVRRLDGSSGWRQFVTAPDLRARRRRHADRRANAHCEAF